MQGALGFVALLLLAWALSENRRAIGWRTVIGGVALQWALAALLIGFPPATRAVMALNDAADALQHAADAGTGFVFGYLVGAPLPFVETRPGASFILAFKALPLVLVISALAALLFHWGVLQAVLRGFAWLLRRSLARLTFSLGLLHVERHDAHACLSGAAKGDAEEGARGVPVSSPVRQARRRQLRRPQHARAPS